MTFETKRLTLSAGSAPIDLAADPDLLLTELGISQGWLAVQNLSTRLVRYAEVEVAPAGTAEDAGHVLSGGSGVILLLTWNRPFWFWSASGAVIALSEGAASPMRPG